MAEIFEVQYYTDPLCSWSWGMEPQLRKLRYLLKDRLSIQYIMGGLLRDWSNFQDPINNVSRPTQLGPLWMETKHVTGQFIDESLWVENPVDTSYLACIAVKAAGIQSLKAEEAMLRELREAVMMNKKNIADKEVILDIAEELSRHQVLQADEFRDAFFSDRAADLFREDLDLIKIKGISRFPTLLITYKGKTRQITGYRPFSVLLDAFKALDPAIDLDENLDEQEYLNSWVHLTEREKKEIQVPDKEPEVQTSTGQ